MKSTLLTCIIIAAGLQTTMVRAQQASGRPPKCQWTEKTINIDGLVNDAAWKPVPPALGFLSPGGGRVENRLLWDRGNLYWASTLRGSKPLTGSERRDEVHLLIRPDRTKPGFYELTIGADGSRRQRFYPKRGAEPIDDLPFELQAAVDASPDRNGWTAEARLSWKSLMPTGGRPVAEELWDFAIGRTHYENDQPVHSGTIEFRAPRGFRDLNGFTAVAFSAPRKRASLVSLPPFTTSRVVGSPEPLKPYRAVNAFPQLKIDKVICVRRLPGTDKLLIIAEGGGSPCSLLTIDDDPAASQTAQLFKLPVIAYDIAFHPDFLKNGLIFVGGHRRDHESKKPHCQILRYRLRREPQVTIDAASEKVIIEWDSNGHNGAAVTFGLDGLFYITTGDGTVRRDIDQVGQRLDTLRAKVLRIDVDNVSDGDSYSVPDDNPFVDFPGARPETWCYGLRNPWRITTDEKTGGVWVGNNGQDAWEQIYLIHRGANYGWSVYEGGQLFISERPLGPTPVSKPTFDHPHSEARSLTGGVVYYGDRLPELRGRYLYGDHSTGRIWAALHDGKEVVEHREIADTSLAITCFETSHRGEMLVVDYRQGGGIYRLQKRETTKPSAPFPRRLTETGLFDSVAEHRVQAGVLPYSVRAPGWHDGADVERFLAIPSEDGAPLKLKLPPRGNGGFALPDGAVAMQTLSLPDGDRRRRVETRLLTKQQGEWAAYTYLWNEDQTDAVLAPALGSRVTLADRVWRAPSRVECMSCHSRANNYLLGLTPAQFNTVHDYGEFRAEQYEVLAQVGWTSIDWLKDARQEWRAKLSAAGVTGDRLDATLKRLTPRGGQRPVPRSTLLHTSSRAGDLLADPWDQSASLDRRARSYLHANCAHCHVLDGGGNSRFVVSWGTTGDDMKLADVKGIHGEFGLPDGLLVKPGDAESSLLAYRLQSLGGGRMPRVGSHEVDAAGVRLIRAWIDSLGSADASGQRRAATAVELKDGERRDKLIVEELKSTNGAMRLARLVDDAQVDEGTRRKIVDAALQHERPGVRDLFEQFIPSTQRVERLGVSFDPRRVLDLLGDARRGRRLFLQGDSISCKNCHRVEEQGRMVGPNLDKIGKRFKRAKVLESIVAPSLLVDEKFAAYSALTADGRVVAGLMVERTDEFIVLRDPTGRDTKIAQEDVEEIRRQQKSLMPDHLIKDLTAQQAADLLAYLMELE